MHAFQVILPIYNPVLTANLGTWPSQWEFRKINCRLRAAPISPSMAVFFCLQGSYLPPASSWICGCVGLRVNGMQAERLFLLRQSRHTDRDM